MIFYALLCRIDGTILVEGFPDEMEGNFPQIAQSLVDFLKEKPATNLDIISADHIPDDPVMHCELYDGARRTFVNSNESDGFFCGMSDVFNFAFGHDPENPTHDSTSNNNFYFHVGREGNLIFLCLADDMSGRRHKVNFAFLQEMHDVFITKFSKSKIQNAISYGMEKSFSVKIRAIIHKYNTNLDAGKSHSVAALHAQVEDLKNVMGQNIYIMLQRGENIESLVNKAEQLEAKANVFHRRTSMVKGKMKTKSVKYQMFIALALVLFCYIIAASFCGVLFEHCIEWHRPE